MQEEYTLDGMRNYCSNYICKYYGEHYDTTPWWDKWRIIGTFQYIKREEEKHAAEIRNSGQENEETT